jgi:hypothetical protein
MHRFSIRAFLATTLSFSTLACVAGCRNRGNPFDMSHQSAAWNQSKQSARQELAQISLPSKSVYASIDKEAQWQNPFLTVESNTIQLRIYLADQNSSQFDRGGLTRLNAARKQTLNIRLKDLPRALSSLPGSAWPYGRVVAVEEALEPPRYSSQLRANVAVTETALTDMGIVVDDWANRGTMP